MSLIERAVKSIGLRQRSYHGLFGEGGPNHNVMTELALYARAFDADQDDLSHDKLMMMHGRRQMFFHIVNHLKLSVDELEAIYITTATRNSRRMPPSQGED